MLNRDRVEDILIGADLHLDLHSNYVCVCVCQIAAVDEDGREDKATIKCETSPPSTPRQVRMARTLPASSHNDAR